MTQPDAPHDDIGCLRALEIFYAYLDRELDPAACAEFERHIEHCLSCYSRAELEGFISERLRAHSSEQAPEGLRRRVRDLLDRLEE